MSWAKGLQDVAVVFAALVGVVNQKRNRRAGGHALVDAAQDLHLVRLLALCHMAAGAGAAAVEVVLDVGLAQSHAWRAAVNHAADGWAVGFTKVGDCEKGAKGVAAHVGDYPCKLFRVTRSHHFSFTFPLYSTTL